MNSSSKINIIEYRDGSFSEKGDSVVTEKRLRIYSNNREILSMLCTPTMIRELVVGFALSERFFGDKESHGNFHQTWCTERIEIFWEDKEVRVNLPVDVTETAATITSGCGKGVTFTRAQDIEPLKQDDFKIGVSELLEFYREFQKKSELFRTTGGIHSAALYDDKEMIVFADDIGRHNAVDKIVGYAFLENISIQGKLLLSSGRLSSEIAFKAARAGIPIVVSRAAPTDMAVEIAKKANITLIGFLRGRHLNIYSNPERVV